MKRSFDLKSNKLSLVLVLLLTGLVYASCLRYEFVYDDNGQIEFNPAIKSVAHIPEYFTNHVWATISPDSAPNYYRPIFLFWFLLNYKLFGLSPAGWHATNILVHLIATWLVFVLARRLTSDQLIATVAAFLFGIHPAHIESVAWISGVTDSLMTVFFLAAIVLYLDNKPVIEAGQESSSPNLRRIFQWRLLLSLVFYSLAIFTKEPAIAFVPIVLCYELLMGKEKSYVSRRTRLTSLFLTILPYLVVTGVYFIARVKVLGGLGQQLTVLPNSIVAMTIPSVLWFYFNHLIWPFPLSVFYDTPYVSGGWLFWAPLAGLVIVISIYIALARRSRLVLFLGCWMFLPILPLLNLKLFGFNQIVHDRYLYLPSVGFCIILSVAFFHVIRNYARYRVPAGALLVIIGTAWALETVLELPQWKNDLALYSHAAAVSPRSNVAINNLASTLKFTGEIDRAIFLSKQVLERDPDNWQSLYNLGHSYYKVGAFDEAIKCLSQSISLNPRAPDQYLFYGLSLMGKSNIADAEAALRTAVSLRPANAKYHFALGVLLKQKGDLPDASVELARSIELDHSLEANARALLTEIEATGKRSN